MVYLHIPFCRSFCTYCGFYSIVVPGDSAGDNLLLSGCGRLSGEKTPCNPSGSLFSDYADMVVREIMDRQDEILEASRPRTLYIGGGTPSLMPVGEFEKVVRALRDVTGIGDGRFEEFTMEANPEDIVEKGVDYLAGLKQLGVNRLSMGVQSFDDKVLALMNRRHNAEGARQAFRMARDAGFDNISIDLIFGISWGSDDDWRMTLKDALQLRPDHISAYQLSIEEGSALERMVADGRYAEASEEQCERQYRILCEELHEAGYNHYEISNFALPGHEAVHNSAYWQRLPYVGLGAGAHTFRVQGAIQKRSWNGELGGHDYSCPSGEEILSADEILEEKLMLALRTSRGIDEAELYECANAAAVQNMLDNGILVKTAGESAVKGTCRSSDESIVRGTGKGTDKTAGSVRIPESHFFQSDSIIRDLLP